MVGIVSLHLGGGRKQSVRRKKNELLNMHDIVYCCARENAAEWTELLSGQFLTVVTANDPLAYLLHSSL